MEWFLVGVDEKPVEADLDEQQLTLTIDAQTTGLNGAMFTCRVTDVEGRQFEESVTITVKGITGFQGHRQMGGGGILSRGPQTFFRKGAPWIHFYFYLSGLHLYPSFFLHSMSERLS